MTIEVQLQELIDVNKAILVALQSGAAVTSATTAKATAKPAETKPETKPEVKAEVKGEALGVTWKEVLTKIQELNKSDKPGHGRDGVLKITKHFGITQEKGAVPLLEGLGKHAEVLAYTKALLEAAPAPADDDLGI